MVGSRGGGGQWGGGAQGWWGPRGGKGLQVVGSRGSGDLGVVGV